MDAVVFLLVFHSIVICALLPSFTIFLWLFLCRSLEVKLSMRSCTPRESKCLMLVALMRELKEHRPAAELANKLTFVVLLLRTSGHVYFSAFSLGSWSGLKGATFAGSFQAISKCSVCGFICERGSVNKSHLVGILIFVRVCVCV